MAVDLAWEDDVYLTDEGDIAIVSEGDQVVSHVQSRLYTYLGEWYFNTAIGIPWISEMFTPETTYEQKAAILKQVIQRTPEVRRIIEFNYGVDPTNRIAEVEYRAETDYSQSIEDDVVIG